MGVCIFTDEERFREVHSRHVAEMGVTMQLGARSYIERCDPDLAGVEIGPKSHADVLAQKAGLLFAWKLLGDRAGAGLGRPVWGQPGASSTPAPAWASRRGAWLRRVGRQEAAPGRVWGWARPDASPGEREVQVQRDRA